MSMSETIIGELEIKVGKARGMAAAFPGPLGVDHRRNLAEWEYLLQVARDWQPDESLVDPDDMRTLSDPPATGTYSDPYFHKGRWSEAAIGESIIGRNDNE